jgi:hypothetical protein
MRAAPVIGVTTKKEATVKRLIPILVAFAALAAPAGAFAGTGIVLKVERGAHLVAVVRDGHVQLAHTTRRGLAMGQRVSVQLRRLRNGTFAATQFRVIGRAHRVHFSGLVLGRSRAAHRITLSAGGAIVSVKSEDQPKPGSEVTVDADVDGAELDDGQMDVVTPAAPGGSIEGHVVALGDGTITIGSERELLVLSVPAGVDVAAIAVGDEVLAQFAQEPDGSLVLSSISADDGAQAADEDGQGSDGHGDGGHGDGGGDGGGGDG